jgi:aspartokinase
MQVSGPGADVLLTGAGFSMPIPEKLGGFKVLKDVARISLVSPEVSGDFPAHVFRVLADQKINLPYATCVFDGQGWGLTIVVEAGDAVRTSAALEMALKKRPNLRTGIAILSIFPHRKNPEITRALFEAFSREGVATDAMASSPSAISVVIDQNILNKASSALFGPFTFSAYRTPADWKLAQKGKEQLYKEVVASYQEKRPKVYGLEYQNQQSFVQVKLSRGQIAGLGPVFGRLSRPGLSLTFLAASPYWESNQEQISFCIPLSEEDPCQQTLREAVPLGDLRSTIPAAAFSMNGPHFGDRYGIVSELLMAFRTGHVDLLGLSCTIASVTGVVPSAHLTAAIDAIQMGFDIPSVIERR